MHLRRTTADLRPHRGRKAAVLVAVVLLVAASPALARDDVRVSGSCGRGASAELRVRAHHDAIEVELRVRRRNHPGERWSVVVVHERRVAWRGRATTDDGGFRVRRTTPDYAGADEISARATNPRGLTCQATATLRS